MTLVTGKYLLNNADKFKYGQPAFNVNFVDQVTSAIEIHEAFHAPLLLQVADLALGFFGGRVDFANSTLEDKIRGAKLIANFVKEKAKETNIPVALHLDHGRTYETVKACIEAGFTSVMYDGSSLPFEENIKNTKAVVDLAKKYNVSVEAELGILAGVEDDVSSENSTYTNPLQALEFVQKTGIDYLAISYGTKHGASKGKNVKLSTEIVTAIKELFLFSNINCQLVSHGSSTIPTYLVESLSKYSMDMGESEGIKIDQIQKAIKAGINKINVDTDIRMATTRNILELFENHPEYKTKDKYKYAYDYIKNNNDFDPRNSLVEFKNEITSGFSDEDYLLKNAMDKAVKEMMGQIIVEFGSIGRA
ncbi:MAG: class II fructose-bisphosphate aldolase [Peptoniphilaceae bacterium]|nr:class II fructose-bisphosphate aldolase [Peptoniphilaceae bacterium]MDD7382797.1 class II fructose-bisphosphate aldolase [Peptoniphilaceae bacterium]MDY3737955.1 class II fructose-bisphosphate aldolase [Peptoniphilaceae bacterium]